MVNSAGAAGVSVMMCVGVNEHEHWKVISQSLSPSHRRL